MNLLLILIVFIEIFVVIKKDYDNFGWLVLGFWFTIGLLSVLLLIYNLVRNFYTKRISINDIDYVEFGTNEEKDIYTIRLKNGKKRIIMVKKATWHLGKMFYDAGLKIYNIKRSNEDHGNI